MAVLIFPSLADVNCCEPRGMSPPLACFLRRKLAAPMIFHKLKSPRGEKTQVKPSAPNILCVGVTGSSGALLIQSLKISISCASMDCRASYHSALLPMGSCTHPLRKRLFFPKHHTVLQEMRYHEGKMSESVPRLRRAISVRIYPLPSKLPEKINAFSHFL